MTPRQNAAAVRYLSGGLRDAARVGRVQREQPAPIADAAGIAVRLAALARRVNCNVPLNHNPARFHEEKDEIAREIAGIADELRGR